MNLFNEGGSTNRPPLLEGPNYPYWKPRMRAFLKSIDEKVWIAVVNGWKPPTVTSDAGTFPKPIESWTKVELELSNFNSKALHALFNAVSINQMKIIANCEIAKDAWDKLQIKNEGTDIVKKTRLRRLITDFENLSMLEDETITDFHGRICDLSNECYALGKVYSNAELVRKVLCSLPKRFMAKVTSIEECRDVDTLDLDELIGSLQTYKLNLKRWNKHKSGDNLVFKQKLETHSFDDVDFESLDEEKMALLTKNYSRFLRRNWEKSNSFNKNKFQPRKNQSNQTNSGSFNSWWCH